jgi:hypothetical protein
MHMILVYDTTPIMHSTVNLDNVLQDLNANLCTSCVCHQVFLVLGAIIPYLPMIPLSPISSLNIIPRQILANIAYMIVPMILPL